MTLQGLLFRRSNLEPAHEAVGLRRWNSAAFMEVMTAALQGGWEEQVAKSSPS